MSEFDVPVPDRRYLVVQADHDAVRLSLTVEQHVGRLLPVAPLALGAVVLMAVVLAAFQSLVALLVVSVGLLALFGATVVLLVRAAPHTLHLAVSPFTVRATGGPTWEASPAQLSVSWRDSLGGDGTFELTVHRGSDVLARYDPVRATPGDLLALQAILSHFGDLARERDGDGPTEIPTGLRRFLSSGHDRSPFR